MARGSLALLTAIFLLTACSSEEAGAPSSSSGGASSSSSGASSSSSGGTTGCDSLALRTGLVTKQTGVSVDAFDCAILAASARYQEPDPMIFKAIIYVESRFDRTSIACPNLPCGTPTGWTEPESRCYGLMQIVPACNGISRTILLPNGHPNLTTDPAAPDYGGSVFNPDVNVDVGISGLAGNRAQVMKTFPGCTTDQYTMMAIGNYNRYGSTKSCTEINADYAKSVLDAYGEYSRAAGYTAHPY